jgi:hypothetical protein
MDLLELNKKYEVLSISRLDLRSLGLTIVQFNQLSDEDVKFCRHYTKLERAVASQRSHIDHTQ